MPIGTPMLDIVLMTVGAVLMVADAHMPSTAFWVRVRRWRSPSE
jgi:hypothetical protein